MNDIEYTFIQDSREKKNIAHSASKRVVGSKSKKCTLPGDYLTPSEKKKLSKDIVSANLRKPMDCDTFRKLSVNLQKEYLEYLRDECGANVGRISKMFKREGSWWYWYIKNKRPELSDIFVGHINVDRESREKWAHFIGEKISDNKSNIIVENTEPGEDGHFHKSYKLKSKKDEDAPYDFNDNSNGNELVADMNVDGKYYGDFSLGFEDVSTEELIDLIRKYFGSREDISFTRIQLSFKQYLSKSDSKCYTESLVSPMQK